MTVAGFPVKRPPRPGGRDRKRQNAFRFALDLVSGTQLDEIASVLPHLDADGRDYDDDSPRRPGRKPDFPAEVYLLFASIMGYTKLSDRDTEALLQDSYLWQPLRDHLVARFPQYKGFDPRRCGPTRSQFHHWQRCIKRDHLLFHALTERFTRAACTQAVAMGMFDEGRTSLSEPDIADMFIGDGTIARAIYNASRGDRQLNPLTGELEQIRFDPDARRQIRKSRDEEVQTTDTSGTHYGVIHGTTGHPNENVMLSSYYVPSGLGFSEAKTSLEYLERLAGLLPGAKGALWDKAMRGKEIDAAYQFGLVLNARVSKAPGGKTKEQLIEVSDIRIGRKVVGQLPLVGLGGAAHVRVEAGPALELVRLIPTKLLKRANTGKQGRKWRWFAEYRVPDDARVPEDMRGGIIRTRLDINEQDASRKINRAENLRPVAEDDDLWAVVGGPRSRAESLFAKAKHKWPNKRIQAVGIPSQMIRLLGFGIGLNADAARHYEERTNRALAPPSGPELLAA